jgi:hypothetical protein
VFFLFCSFHRGLSSLFFFFFISKNKRSFFILLQDDEREIIPESLAFPELKTLYIFACAELEYVSLSLCLQVFRTWKR